MRAIVCLAALLLLAPIARAQQATSVSFNIAASDRIAGKTGVAATLSFTPTTSIPASGLITLSYPSGFFAAGVVPIVNSYINGLNSSATGATAVVITTSFTAIPSGTFFTVTLSGLTMGPATPGVMGISVITSSDATASNPVFSGSIDAAASSSVTFLSLTFQSSYSGAAVSPVLDFRPVNAIPVGAAITLNMPVGYFIGQASIGPSTVASLNGFASFSDAKSSQIVITTASQTIPCCADIRVTVSGLTLGLAQAGGAFSMSTSSDPVTSNTLPASSISPGPSTTPAPAMMPPTNRTVGSILGLALALQHTTKAYVTTATVSFTPTTGFALSSSSGIFITLSGSPSVSSLSTCTVILPTGLGCVASMPSGGPILRILLNSLYGSPMTLHANAAVLLYFDKFTNPASEQAAITNVGGYTSFDGINVVDTCANGTFPAIGINGSGSLYLAITLSTAVKFSSTSATINFATSKPIAAGTHSGIAITLAGSGFSLSSDSTCAVLGITLCVASLSNSVLSVRITSAGIPAFYMATVVITHFNTPPYILPAANNLAAGTSNDLSASTPDILESTTSGTFPSITDGILVPSRLSSFAVLLSSTGAGNSGRATFTFTPVSTINFSKIVITLTGFSSTSTDVPTADFVGFSGTPGASAKLEYGVLTVTFWSGMLTSGSPVSFACLNIINPINAQSAQMNIAAATFSSSGVVLDFTTNGTLPAIVLTKVIGVTFSVSDRVPYSTGKAATVSFILSSALGTGDVITINYPSGFFSAGPALSVMSTSGALSSVATGPSFIVLTVPTGTNFAAGSPAVITLVGLTMGSPTSGSKNGITVSTSKDLVSDGVDSGSIGGQVSGVSLTIAAADRRPNSSGKSVTVSFTTATVLLASQSVTITWPPGYLYGTIGVNYEGVANTFSTTTGGFGSSGVTIAVGSNTAVAGVYTITLTGCTIGAPTAGSSTGIAVSTYSDLPGFGGCPALGGRVSAVSFAIAPADRIPAATSKSVTVSFIIESALFSGDTVTINYPIGFFTSGISPVLNSNTQFTSAVASASAFILTVSPGMQLAAGAVTLTLFGLTFGPPTTGSKTGVTVSTSMDLVSAGVDSGTLGGQVYAVSIRIAAVDRIPMATGKSVTVSFTTSSPLWSGQFVSISWPSNYMSGSIGVIFGVPNVFIPYTNPSDNSGIILSVGSAGASAAAYTITLTGATLGMPTSPSQDGVRVSTSSDLAGTGATSAIGGQVTSVSFMIAAADRVPLSTSKPITVSFVTATQLPAYFDSAITVSWPPGYLSGSMGVIGSSNMFATYSLNFGNANTGVTIGTGPSEIPAGFYTVTLTGASIGPATSASANTGIKVSTRYDQAGECGHPSLGGRVNTYLFSIAAIDRMPYAVGKSITVGFTIETALVPADLITINFPNSFFMPHSGPIVSSSSDFLPGVLYPSSVVLSLSSGTIKSPGSHTITLSGLNLGKATSGSMTGISVSTTRDFSSSSAPSGSIGSQVQDITFDIAPGSLVPGAVGINAVVSFTTNLALPKYSSISITWPKFFFNSSSASILMTGGYSTMHALSADGISVSPIFDSPAGRFVVTFVGVTLGSPTGSYINGISVSTDFQRVGSTRNPALGNAPGFVYGCVPSSFTSCSAPQSRYLLDVITPLLCSSGSVYSPNGLDSSNGCPRSIGFSANSENCIFGPIPSYCSKESIAIASIPDVCNVGFFPAPGGIDSSGCPNIPVGMPSSSVGNTSAFPSNVTQQNPGQQCPYPVGNNIQNKFRLTFATSGLCTLNATTRSCISKNASLVQEIRAQCARLPCSATSSTRAVCAIIPSYQDPVIHDALSTLLSEELDPVTVCVSTKNPFSFALKALLQAISNTESRDPRDSSATATILLNLCFSSCRDSTAATMLGVIAASKMTPGSKFFSRFCTDPVMALLWHHGSNAPRECSDSLISTINERDLQVIFGRNVTTCALQSMLPSYLALCDARAVQCEEMMLAIPSSAIDSCKDSFEAGKTCSSQCAALSMQLSSSKCFESVWSVQQAIADAVNQTCVGSGANGAVRLMVIVVHVTQYSAPLMLDLGLNSNCNLSLPFPVELPDISQMLGASWSPNRGLNQAAAFHVENQNLQAQDDPRHIVDEVAHGPTFMVAVEYSLSVNLALSSNLNMFQDIMKNLTDGVASGLCALIPGHRTTCFSLPTDIESSVVQIASAVPEGLLVVKSNSFLFSFNTTAVSTFDFNAWTAHAVNFFRTRAPSSQIRDLVSAATFTISNVRNVDVFPPLQQPNVVFEFTAAPLMTQRLPPPTATALLNGNGDAYNSFFEALGVPSSSHSVSTLSLLNADVTFIQAFPARVHLRQGWAQALALHLPFYSSVESTVLVLLEQTCFSTGCMGCSAFLRYPRSSFGPGNITFLWSRAVSTPAPVDEAMLLQPDARHLVNGNMVEFGRITIQISIDGRASHNYGSNRITVTDDSVFISLNLLSPSALTLHAVRKTKIEANEFDFSTKIFPMQPTSQRAFGVTYNILPSTPIDFTCIELDTSSHSGSSPPSPAPVQCQTSSYFTGIRALFTVLASGMIDPACSIMHSFYPQHDDLYKPAPESPGACGQTNLPPCNSYYSQGLFRQHTNTSSFTNFSAMLGGSALSKTPGYHLVCLSASGRDSGHVMQDGAIVVRFQKMGMKDIRSCHA